MGKKRSGYFDGTDDAGLWRALHDPEFREMLTEKGRKTFPLPTDNSGEIIMKSSIHPAPAEFTAGQLDADPILRYFHYAHLPTPLQEISSAFCSLAAFMIEALPRNAERSAGLRKLLEAKDCAVRANVGSLKPRTVDDFPVEGEIRTTGGGSIETPVPFKD